MQNVVYVVTSLKNKGPTQQLINIISNIDHDSFRPVVISLTPEVTGDRTKSIKDLNIKVVCCDTSLYNFVGLYFQFRNFIEQLNPAILHSSGILPDLFCLMRKHSNQIMTTVRNDPLVDYPLKFGYLLGQVMGTAHLKIIKKFKHVVACSDALSDIFGSYGIKTLVIRNGVDISSARSVNNKKNTLDRNKSRISVISAGTLNERKNAELMVSLFCSKELQRACDFFLLGNGDRLKKCKEIATPNVHLLGHVDDVSLYLSSADFYISLSKSEGMPNSVMEALLSGLPCILSNIGPHQEIASFFPQDIFLLDTEISKFELSNQIFTIVTQSQLRCPRKIKQSAELIFDSKINSAEYQKLYYKFTEIKNEKIF